jgi:hypothetical protein
MSVERIRDIPESFKLTPVQHRAYDCACSGRPWFGPELPDALSTLRYPLHFMDFETFYPALSRHIGMRPYSHIPFQWSVHARDRPGAELRHHEFLAEDATDPWRRFPETLLDVLSATGSIVVYNRQFEAERLKDLAGWFPEHAKQIASMRTRLWDLLPVVRDNVYHPEFRGSFSIKKTLPALGPEMTYEGMEITEGSAAGLAWETLVHAQLSPSEKTKLRAVLLAYLCSIPDGSSRHIVNWDLRESMTEADIEIILQGAKEKYPEARPRIISDNGAQFIAKDLKEFIRVSGMTPVRTSPFSLPSNGKIERWHKSLKGECIRPGMPLSLEDARRLVEGYVEHYSDVRLNSAVCYITPRDMRRDVSRDPRGTRPQAGSGQATTAESPPASHAKEQEGPGCEKPTQACLPKRSVAE